MGSKKFTKQEDEFAILFHFVAPQNMLNKNLLAQGLIHHISAARIGLHPVRHGEDSLNACLRCCRSKEQLEQSEERRSLGQTQIRSGQSIPPETNE